jgi:hypothetical protein
VTNPFQQFVQQPDQPAADAPAADNPFSQFAQPAAEPDAPESSPVAGYAKDMLAAWGIGSNRLLETAGGLYGLVSGDMDNWATRQGASGVEFYEGMKSDGYREAERKRDAAIEGADGMLMQFAQGAWQTLKDPRFLTEQLPMMVGPGGAGMAAGRALGKTAGVVAGAGTGAALQGSDIGKQTYDELLQLPDNFWQANPEYASMVADGVDPGQAKDQIAMGLARTAAAASGTASLATNVLPGARTFERAAARVPGDGNVLGRAVKGFIGEGVQEALEEGPGGQMVTNLAVGQVDPTRSAGEGVAAAAGQGFGAGGPFGAISGAANTATEQQQEVSDAEAQAALKELEEADAELQQEQVLQERRARGAEADQAATIAAAEVEAAGGDPLDALNAATRAYNAVDERQKEQAAVAQQLDALNQPGQDQDTFAPGDQQSGARVALEEQATLARQRGDETGAVRLDNARRMLDTAERFESQGRVQQARNFRSRAEAIVSDQQRKTAAVPFVSQGQLEQAERVRAAPPPQGGPAPVTIDQPRAANPAQPLLGQNRDYDPNPIIGTNAQGPAEQFRAEERAARNELAMEGTFAPGQPAVPAAPMRNFGTELPGDEIVLGTPETADEVVDDTAYLGEQVSDADYIGEAVEGADAVSLSDVDFNDAMESARAMRSLDETLAPLSGATVREAVQDGAGRTIEAGRPAAPEVRRMQKRLHVMDQLMRCLG